ncbi:uncharacterized protein BO80DRAFT_347375 [Aspergillus ibericus CBS 121593]|uniref:Thioredoxin-like protein n=1 Tax=Aspergillus ibericus CBS 121593 TaxID=1448316 RepID=A0A395H9K2_9EURO|nr:hypothetical protein BO80DRAFT_347375 [Aspergillus ibericus CBS 121593]RAL04641.1 hypothetical protein BO80DRAFT_347375 [Aspergillus ibericus CBS 121593]
MSDSTLYLYTSLTAGSSHIVTATARLETILKANKLPFRAIDVATDEVARKLWGRRSKGKKLPGLVKFGTVVGDLEQVEEWNEYGELRMQVNSVEDFDSIPASSTTIAQPETPSATSTPTPETAAPKQSTIKIQSPPSKETPKDSSIAVAMRQASEEAAAKAKSQPAAAKAPVPAVTEKKETPAADEQSQAGKEDTVRGNTAAPDTQDSKPKRPPLVPEVAAESSANFHADAAEALGLVQHHRGSIISATSKEEQEKVAQDLRKSISGGQQDLLQSLREDHAARTEQEETIEEESDGGEQQDGAQGRQEAQDAKVSG